ncbi:MAG: universal stress protein [Rickettsiaceae bacterium]|jgi:nucleotide-binding universal stress UspA family protein|nr:universal stress protein [Rickettsiaceae bacterium]
MFKNIIIPIDLSDKQSLRAVFPPALNFVNAFGSKLHLIYIMPDFGMKMIEDYLPRHWMSDQKQKYTKQFDEIVDKYIPKGADVDYYIGRGAVYDEVIKYSENENADLIIISAVRPQLRDYMLGPNASKIVRHSSISVMVVRD